MILCDGFSSTHFGRWKVKLHNILCVRILWIKFFTKSEQWCFYWAPDFCLPRSIKLQFFHPRNFKVSINHRFNRLMPAFARIFPFIQPTIKPKYRTITMTDCWDGDILPRVVKSSVTLRLQSWSRKRNRFAFRRWNFSQARLSFRKQPWRCGKRLRAFVHRFHFLPVIADVSIFLKQFCSVMWWREDRKSALFSTKLY